MCCCCPPLVTVTGVSVNTTTNIATLSLTSALPTSGIFRLSFPNVGSILPSQTPQATVQLNGGGTSYTLVYNCPSCSCSTPGIVKLSSIVRKTTNNPILHGVVGTDGTTVFLTDKLPTACISYTTVTS